MAGIYHVAGMTCEGCAKAVTNAVKAQAPHAVVTVDLKAGRIAVEGFDDVAAIAKAVDDAGFEFGGAAKS
ncbi:MAG: heavy metal transporter [Rhodospirillales bacterium RIFCSPLOWO2_12_FULL_58_28]|nr:MAG: heavy metal transporter [Rhodospirillales bacterium RIFCSPLOWO2_02_FULL_58_16]OHC79011.1 MAG: heavy metal transporter [Rhodospirillales bacterium RIFCSPLOWO2_12_FULL_58_28]